MLPACTAAVRISPSLRFTYVEQKLMPLYLLLFRPEQAPSMLAPAMTLRELGDRMDLGCRLPSLVYPGQEHYYMQSPLWQGIMQDIDMHGPPFSCLTHPGHSPSLLHLAVYSNDDALPSSVAQGSFSHPSQWCDLKPLCYIKSGNLKLHAVLAHARALIPDCTIKACSDACYTCRRCQLAGLG